MKDRIPPSQRPERRQMFVASSVGSVPLISDDPTRAIGLIQDELAALVPAGEVPLTATFIGAGDEVTRLEFTVQCHESKDLADSAIKTIVASKRPLAALVHFECWMVTTTSEDELERLAQSGLASVPGRTEAMMLIYESPAQRACLQAPIVRRDGARSLGDWKRLHHVEAERFAGYFRSHHDRRGRPAC